jgi:hypothetical protein
LSQCEPAVWAIRLWLCDCDEGAVAHRSPEQCTFNSIALCQLFRSVLSPPPMGVRWLPSVNIQPYQPYNLYPHLLSSPSPVHGALLLVPQCLQAGNEALPADCVGVVDGESNCTLPVVGEQRLAASSRHIACGQHHPALPAPYQ